VVAQLTKDMQTEQLLCWSGMTDPEHSTSGLNKEESELVNISDGVKRFKYTQLRVGFRLLVTIKLNNEEMTLNSISYDSL